MRDDTISRQAVLDLLIRCAVPENGGSLLYQGIKQLPSAERHGRWVYHKGDCFPKCSVCGQHNGTLYEYRYCPTCGASMGEIEE